MLSAITYSCARLLTLTVCNPSIVLHRRILKEDPERIKRMEITHVKLLSGGALLFPRFALFYIPVYNTMVF